MSAPLISVIVPVHNRAGVIGRCLASCLVQPGPSFEVIVVDDASTDGSVAAVQAVTDQRVRLLQHDRNRGWCAARNTGGAEARAEWLLFLDSDDELVPGALAAIERWAAKADAADAHKLFLMCQWSNGVRSPDPPLAEEVWDYAGFVQWFERMLGRPTECIVCARRSAQLAVPYPANGFSPEGIHHFDFARRFRALACPEVVRIYHQDADNRVMKAIGTRFVARYTEAAYLEARQVLERHGAEWRTLAPRLLTAYYQRAALYAMLSGRRLEGARYSTRQLRREPRSLAAWGILAAGLIGPRALARAQELHARRSAA
jgi:glycosyltransferase involved in cell wall biosynthesis